MTCFSKTFRVAAVAVFALSLVGLGVGGAAAQSCSTCATPTVAFAPVVPATTVTLSPVTGWYPGRAFDNWRLRRWTNRQSFATTTTTFPTFATTTTAAPTFASLQPVATTVGFAPTFVSPQPVATTVGFAPTFVSSQPVATTVAFAPTAAVESCSACSSQVVLRPVVEASCPTCSTCTAAPACDACSAATPVSFEQPVSGCSSCAASTATTPAFTTPATSFPASGTSYPTPASSSDPITPQPQLNETTPTPYGSNFPSSGATTPVAAPGPAAEDGKGASYLEPPQLLGPNGDRTANRPSVDVWTAVYRGPATARSTSTSATAAPIQTRPTQAELDAQGWHAVKSVQ